VFRKNEELFVENSWVQVMMGQGIVPQSWHPVAARLPDRELEGFLRMLRESVSRTVDGLPQHQDYVARYCGTEAERAA
jgi:tryptophan halogenase